MSGNSMEAPSERVEGDQNDQTVQPSATEIKKAKRRASDKKYLDGKKQKLEDTRRELETVKASYAESEKSNAYLKGQLDQLMKDLEHSRETNRRLEQKVDHQTIKIDQLQQLVQSLFQTTPGGMYDTGEAAPGQHAALYQPETETAMGSGGSTMQGPPVPQVCGHGNDSELLSQSVSLNLLNSTYPPDGTAMGSGGSAMQGPFVP